MEYSNAIMKVLVFLACTTHLALAGSHSLQYFYTAVTPGINFPEYTSVGLVDGEQIVYCDSNIRKNIPKTEWMEKNEGAEYWDRQTQICLRQQKNFKVNLGTAMGRFNQTKGVHTVQRMVACELDDDGTKRGYRQDAYDGEDFISLDMNTQTWTAPKPQAVITKNKWEATGVAATHYKNYLENTCIESLQKYVSYGRDTLERKDHPEVSVFQKDSSAVCHATGFFPKAVMISWQKDGEDVNENVELRETLPNHDGTFQKKSILILSPEELKNHKYTCVVQHSGLDIVMPLHPGGVSVGVIVGVVAVLLLVLIGCVGFFIWRKKKNDFKPVAASDGEGSSTSSK
ncbi:DLA class I histocompatibility antigen, A9/A9 alpha chain-like [Brachyhypopomus gauderio]|uniref:DLA class I histocompatibility antigen, A9/A9 alpha chain-like n=1 Tax=Brachyhypopomus gauderio TaxID=698409 RepID=UPI004042DBF9